MSLELLERLYNGNGDGEPPLALPPLATVTLHSLPRAAPYIRFIVAISSDVTLMTVEYTSA